MRSPCVMCEVGRGELGHLGRSGPGRARGEFENSRHAIIKRTLLAVRKAPLPSM